MPIYEHDDNQFLEKREQLSYNAEDRGRVMSKYDLPSRSELLRPPLHSHFSKFESGLMYRRDAPRRSMYADGNPNA